ncbi:hypothetical protein [Streptomyces sp. NPDC051286]|uniref:hypothetical protein n=1 Tax=Streptomyces sp. NPDC051286 TaxID=3365647 RepID=UPI00378F3D99
MGSLHAPGQLHSPRLQLRELPSRDADALHAIQVDADVPRHTMDSVCSSGVEPIHLPVGEDVSAGAEGEVGWGGPAQGVRAAGLGVVPGAFEGVGVAVGVCSVVSVVKSLVRTGEFVAPGLSQTYADCVNPGL